MIMADSNGKLFAIAIAIIALLGFSLAFYSVGFWIASVVLLLMAVFLVVVLAGVATGKAEKKAR